MQEEKNCILSFKFPILILQCILLQCCTSGDCCRIRSDSVSAERAVPSGCRGGRPWDRCLAYCLLKWCSNAGIVLILLCFNFVQNCANILAVIHVAIAPQQVLLSPMTNFLTLAVSVCHSMCEYCNGRLRRSLYNVSVSEY